MKMSAIEQLNPEQLSILLNLEAFTCWSMQDSAEALGHVLAAKVMPELGPRSSNIYCGAHHKKAGVGVANRD
jgi:hypothetical protein